MAFTQNEDMVQTLPPDRADEPLREGILPRAVGRREDFADPHALDASSKRLAVDAVAIAEEVGRRGVVRECVDELLGGPGGGGMLGAVEVDDAPAMVVEHEQDEQDARLSGVRGGEIDRDRDPDMSG